MELRHLRYALALAEHAHFGNAARALGIAQPTLSAQIAALERELGVRLFNRDTHHVAATFVGEEFLRTAAHVMESVDRARSDAERAARGETGRIAVSFLGTATYTVLPKVFRTFASRYPSVQIRPIEQHTSAQAAAILAGRMDVGFVRPPLTDEQAVGLNMLPVSHEALVAALPSHHVFASHASIPVSELARERLVLAPRSDEPAVHATIQRMCHDAGFEPIVTAEASQLHTLFGLVAGGIGIAVGPASWELIGSRDVICKPLTPRTAMPNLTMIWRRSGNTLVVRNFVALVRELNERDELWPRRG